MKEIELKLNQAIEGEVRFDTFSKKIYSVDASIYEIDPIGVVLPKHQKDLIQVVQIASDAEVPLIPRGAATGIAGGCIGRGIIIDTTKYLNHILETNLEEEYVICEPGVVQDQLNAHLAPHGYRLGPDTSTGNRATIGGMIANNSAGARSLRFGKMGDHILELELILSGGELLQCGTVTEEELVKKAEKKGREGKIFRTLLSIRNTHQERIRERFPPIPRRVSGYNLSELLHSPFHLGQIIAGSEGTLGVVSKVKLRIEKIPSHLGLGTLHCTSLQEALCQVSRLLETRPLSLEVIDDQVIKMGRLSPAMRGKLDWLEGEPQALLMVEYDGESKEEVKDKLSHLKELVAREELCAGIHTSTDPEQMELVWALRKAGLGLIMSRRSYSRAIGFLEDFSVHPHQLAPFLERFMSYLAKHQKQAGVYGHAGAGCVHVRPFMNLRKEDDLQMMRKMMIDTADLILEFQGSLSGEHGDGLVRSWLNKKMFGEEIYTAFCELKAAFDPKGLMNPGKVVHAPDLFQDLRMTPHTQQTQISTQFDFSRQGGFELAIDLCNGNGQCRKRSDLMCPSFQAFGDEQHTTRARAQSLRAIVNKHLSKEQFTSEELHSVLSHCLECKGCKTECPSQVDMAKMKAEFLYHYQKEKGVSLRTRLFTSLPTLNRIASTFPKVANATAKSRLQKVLLNWVGITPERELPPFAEERFSSWVARQAAPQPGLPKVVLYNDTYTEFNYPEVGKAAYHILSKLGYAVHVPPWRCCGRPWISKGRLPQAKEKAQALVDLLYPYAKEQIPIIGLEPSCFSALQDDYKDLISGNQRQLVTDQVISFDQFLSREIERGGFQLNFQKKDVDVAVHGHCHQKALVGMEPTLNVLKTVPGFRVQLIPSGCCGLAGSFGYEQEHYAMSMAIAEDRLFPALRSLPPNAWVVANGLSCRSQISHGLALQPLHLAQALYQSLRSTAP